MGAGIAAGAFMDGFYKGYSLMDKSKREKEELELKKADKEAKLKEASSKLDSEMATKVTSATKEINDLEIKEAKAYEDGDMEQVNTLRTSKATLIDSYNNEFKVASTNSGKEFKPIEISKGSILPITSVDYNGVKYGVLEPDKKLVDEAISNGTVKVTDDGKLGILYVNDLDGKVTDQISKLYEKLPKKEDKTGKDSDMKFAWKEHNSNLPEGETPISFPDFKALYWDKKSTSLEQRYTEAKTRLSTNMYASGQYGEATREADTAIVNKYEEKGQFGKQPQLSESDKKLAFWEKSNIGLKNSDPVKYEEERQKYIGKITDANVYGGAYGVQQKYTENISEIKTEVEGIFTGEKKTDIKGLKDIETNLLNNYKQSQPEIYKELSSVKKDINDKKMLAMELDAIVRDTGKFIGKKTMKTGLIDNISKEVKILTGLTDETLIDSINVNTRLGIAQAGFLKAMSGLTVNQAEAKIYEGFFKGNKFSDENALIEATKSMTNAIKRNIATTGYNYREDLPSTYLDTKNFTKVDIGSERGTSTVKKPIKTSSGKILDLNKYKK